MVNIGKSICVYLRLWKACKPLKQSTHVLPMFQYMYLVCCFKFVLKKWMFVRRFWFFLVSKDYQSLPELCKWLKMDSPRVRWPVPFVCLRVLLTDFGLVICWLEITAEGQGRVGQGQQLMFRVRYLRVLALCYRHSTARGLRKDFQLATGVLVSNQTIRNTLHDDALQSRHPAIGPILTVAHSRDRWIFAQDHIGWQWDKWCTVLCTDKSRFHVCTCDRRVRVRRRDEERYMDCNIVEHDRFGSGSVMFWGGMEGV